MDKNFLKKIIEVQSTLEVKKTGYNKFGDFYFRNLEDILQSLKPLLKEQGLYLKITDKIIIVGDRYYNEATAIVFDENGSLENTAQARESLILPKMSEAQATGASSSYARKYALCGLFGIDEGSDPDKLPNNDKKEVPLRPRNEVKASARDKPLDEFKEKDNIMSEIAKVMGGLTDGYTKEQKATALKGYLNVDNFADLKKKTVERLKNDLSLVEKLLSEKNK